MTVSQFVRLPSANRGIASSYPIFVLCSNEGAQIERRGCKRLLVAAILLL